MNAIVLRIIRLIETGNMMKCLKGLGIVLILMIGVCLVSWNQKRKLPPLAEIVPEVKEAPRQAETTRKTFNLDYRGKKFRIDPMAEYEISGLVVSHNNVNSLGDIYHDSDAVDIKDIALIWGSNVSRPDYLRVAFSSNCYVVNWRYPRGVKFDHFEIANNHLLSGDPTVRRTIMDARVGDQLRLKGMLVNYTDPSRRGTRTTSMTRNDTDMGACEVIYVEEAELLKPGNPEWHLVFMISKWGTISIAGLILLGFCYSVWRDSRAISRSSED